MQRPARVPSHLPESLHKRLNAYALAASAAGVGVLALTQPADARIVYTPRHHVIVGRENYKLDLNHDGIVDFTLQNHVKAASNGGWISAIPAAGNGVSGFMKSSYSFWASALRLGEVIGTKHYFPGKLMAFVHTTGDGGTDSGGSWANVKNRYLGLEFKIGGKAHFGWARLNVQVQKLSITTTLTGYAYETIPNKPIIAGRTHGKDDAEYDSGTGASLTNPIQDKQPATLGALALGAPGLSIWRREESAGATQ